MRYSFARFWSDDRGFIDPATAATAAKSTIDIAAFFSKLLGRLPRGDFQKFQRTIYPLMTAQADETGKAVYAWWFGDVIRVGPGGIWSSVMQSGNLGEAVEYIKNRTNVEGVVFMLSCRDGVDFESASSMQQMCTFVRFTATLTGRIIEAVTERITPGSEFTPVPGSDQIEPGTVDSPFGNIPFFSSASLTPNMGTLLIVGTIIGLILVFRKGK